MKIVLQDGMKDCGICSLLSVIRYYGGEVSKEFLREITNTNKSGVSAYNLVEGAKSIGFEAMGVKGDLSKIEKNNLPCLAHLVVNKSYKHFVVIYDINYNTNKVIVMDPAKGKRVFTIGEFKLLATGNYIFLKPIKPLPIFNRVKFLKKILREFINRKGKFIGLIVVLTICYFILQIVTAFHFKYLLEFSINYKISNNILFLSLYILILYFFREISSLFRDILLTKMLNTLDLEITLVTFRHLLLLPYLYFKNRTTGEVISRLRDLNIIKSFVGQMMLGAFSDMLGFIVFGYLLFKLNKRFFKYIVFTCIILFILQSVFNYFKKSMLRKVNSSNDVVNSYLVEAISNIETIKGNHQEKRFIDKFRIKYQDFLEKSYSFNRNQELYSFFKRINNNILMVIILGLGSYLVVRDEMSLGQLFVYQNIFNYFIFCFSNLLNLEGLYQEFSITMKRVEDLFTIRDENFKGGHYYSLYRLKGDIEISNLSYNFGDKNLFSDVSFKVLQGEKILLVGESGTGKSTLVKMLLRYINVSYGYIKIDNIDINHYHLDTIRNNITYISNNDTLFRDTIYNNIVLNKRIDKDKFKNITEITRIDEIVKNRELGYQEIVEENGFNFSSGERQRIILARALVRDSDIYIFDEAFSQIDIDKTRKILEGVLEFLNDKTVIVISHRNNFYKLFGRVLKLENGKVYEISEL